MTEQFEHALILRRDAAQATLEQWRGVRLRLGYADCSRMVASHLRRFGYQVRLPSEGSYRTVKSARAALNKQGFDDLAGALDALGLARIAPAAALVGDIIEMPSAVDALGCLTVALSNGRVCGWWGEGREGATVLQPLTPIAAWRVEPKG